jgi:DNA-binding transcriptional MerR regulator
MTVRLAIGDFSRMTYLSVKTLHHYHDIGLLVPAEIDPATGYRYYDPVQVPTAQVIRRFRDLDMPLEDVRAVLGAPDPATRSKLIVAHLTQMESQLEQVQGAVASLRTLLERPAAEPIAVEHRAVPATRTVAVTEPVAMDDLEGWWTSAFEELHDSLRKAGVHPAGPDGALYPSEFFQDGLGEVVAFVPVSEPIPAVGRVKAVELPATELAVTVHQGAFSDLDQTYGALGTYIAEREIGVDGPIRESYVISSTNTADETAHRTEVGWPVFQTTPPRSARAR